MRVRGICSCGTVVDTQAALDSRGRPKATWRGPCPKRTCGKTVIARRVRDDEPAPAGAVGPEKQRETPSAQPGKAKRQIVRASYGTVPKDYVAPAVVPAATRVPAPKPQPQPVKPTPGEQHPSSSPGDDTPTVEHVHRAGRSEAGNGHHPFGDLFGWN